MNQIKWKYLNSCSFEILRADFFMTLWNDEADNPAYPDNEEEVDEVDVPDNVNYSSSTITFGAGYRRGISGYIFENIKFNNRNTLQAVFWERFCDLLDSIHTFTIGYNNDYWHEYPYFEDDVDEDIQEKAYEKYYEKMNDDIIKLEDDIVELARTVSKSNNESDKFCYKRVNRFIDAKKNYIDVQWCDIEKWDDAKKVLLNQLELFFEAVGPDPFLVSYIDNYLPKQDKQHFDWRINPILRDIFLGYLTRNPFLMKLDGGFLKDTQVSESLFNNPKNSFGNMIKSIEFDGKNQMVIDDYDSLIEEKYKRSVISNENMSYKETVAFWKESLGTYFVQTD